MAAGTDLQLTYSAMTGDFADTSNASVVKQLRQATKNVLYTTVNSNMMQGMAPGSVVRYGTATWQYAVYGVTAALVAIAAVLVFFGLRKLGVIPASKKSKASDNDADANTGGAVVA